MGGDFENKTPAAKVGENTVTSPRTTTVELESGPVVIPGVPANQSLRFHKKGNEVHFHDDANKLKCLVPAAEWYGIARNIRAMRESFYIDKTHKTFLRVEPFVKDGVADLSISVEPISFGPTLEAIEGFCTQLGV